MVNHSFSLAKRPSRIRMLTPSRCGENFACERAVDFDTDVTAIEVAGPSSQATFTCVAGLVCEQSAGRTLL